MTEPGGRPTAAHVAERAPTVSACLVTFDRLDKLRRAVDRLLDEPIGHLVVVDNGSTDGSREWLRSLDDPRVVVIESERNLGGAGGFELAMRFTIEHHEADWVLLQDDDAWPVDGAVQRFQELVLEPDVGGVAAAVYTPGGEICEINRPGLNPFTGLIGMGRALVRGRMALHVAVSFVGYFVRAELVRTGLGYPRGELFIYSDDQLYSFDVRRHGYRNVFVPAVEFRHDTVSKSDAGFFSPVWKVYFLYRNNIEFYRAMAGRWFPVVMLVKLPVWLLRVRHYPERRDYLRAMWWGVRDGFARRFDRTFDDVRNLCDRSVGR
jgi:GT2 family glycosyltransferase